MELYKFKQEDGDIHLIASPSKDEAIVHWKELLPVPFDGVEVTEIQKSEWNTIVVDFGEIEPEESDEGYSESYPNGHNKDEYEGGYLICGTYRDLVNGVSSLTEVIASNTLD